MDSACLEATTRVLLDPDARWAHQADRLVISTADVEARVCGLGAQQASAILLAMDGSHTLVDIGAITGHTLEELRELLVPLVGAGIARTHPDPSAPITGAAFAALCRCVFPEWKNRLFQHPLWSSLAEGTASRDVFVGWLVESYHFIEGVTLRLPMCICMCRDPHMRAHFVRHYAQEYDHRHFFLKSLAAAGIDDVADRNPLPGTHAVLGCMREAARRDSLAYAACSAFLESTGADRRNARSFFGRIAQHYDDSPGAPIVSPMADHVVLDESYGHDGFIEKICGGITVVSRERTDAALGAAWALVETLEFWSQSILDHYSAHAPSCAVPRRYGMDRSFARSRRAEATA
jgi:hypothetical protein